MIGIIVIAIAAIIFLAGVIIVIAGSGSEKRKWGRSGGLEIGTGRREIVEGGVNTSNLHYGKGAGDDFLAGQRSYGTQVSKNGSTHRMWYAHFEFLGKGRKETVIFRSKMAIGRKEEDMQKYPNLVIRDDRRLSSVHCYLIGTRDLEGNEIDIPMALRWKLDDYMDRLEDAMYENWKLGFLLENWDNRQGDFIHVPQEPEIIPDPKFPLYAPPLQPDDMNPGVVIGGNSDISPQAQLTGDLDDRQLKLEFDEPETAPDSRGLGSLSDPMPKRFA